MLFEKLKKVLDKGYELSAGLLPDAAGKQLKALKDEIDDFLKPQGSTAGNLPEGGMKTTPQSSKPIKSKGDLEQPQPVGNLDKNATKGPGGNENNVSPKTTTKTPQPDKELQAERQRLVETLRCRQMGWNHEQGALSKVETLLVFPEQKKLWGRSLNRLQLKALI